MTSPRRLLGTLAQRRSSSVVALMLAFASPGCTPALDIDDYEFRRAAIGGETHSDNGGSSGESGSNGSGGDSNGGSGNGGTTTEGNGGSDVTGNGGDAGSDDFDAGLSEDAGADSGEPGGGGSSGSGGGGTGGSGGSGGGGTGGSGGSGGGGSGSGGSSGGGGCGVAEVCVPTIPVGWTGPIAVSSISGVTSCPGTYATPLGNVNAGLNAPAASCGCGCFVNGVNCYIESENTGDEFAPESSCESPPTNNDCLAARVFAGCSTTVSQSVTPISWSTTRLTCGGATTVDSCTGGACYPAASSFGQVCISQNADVSCPSAFPNRTLMHRSVTDTRSCAACNCNTSGHVCEIELEICSVGFFDVTLRSNDSEPLCLDSGSGDGVTFFSSTISPGQGSCSTVGGGAQGSAVPSNPVTICCL